MAGMWTTAQGGCNSVSYGQLTGTTAMTSIASNASANTKGSYAQLTAASTAEATGVIIMMSGWTAVGNNQSMDLAVGAAGVEKIIVPDVAIQELSMGVSTYYFPVAIALGSRIAARTQGSGASDSLQIAIITIDGTGWSGAVGGQKCDVLGFPGGGTYGTSVDAGATANTAGAWVQLVASTSADYSGFVLGLMSTTSSATAATYLIDVGIGGAGSEKVLLSQYGVRATGTNAPLTPVSTPFIGTPIAAGSRVAVRAYCSSNTAGLRALYANMYAIIQ